MNDKNKIIVQDILNEISNLKKYNNEIANNVSGKTLENYVNKINKDIVEMQNKIENNYLDNNTIETLD